jgi:methylenetetrahydrofolate reductase (NADPH)
MSSLASHYSAGPLAISFELFPPKTAEGEENLFEHVAQLVRFSPRFITCTYGAGGSTRDKTLHVVEKVKRRFELPVATHLTCVGATVDDLRGYLREAMRRRIDYVVALRGDPPRGETEFRAAQGGLRFANELVALVRAEFPHFGVAVAGYPETHQEAPDAPTDLANLRRKVDAGADVVITQLFYDNAAFFDFRERCRAAEISVPIVPGILPITNFAQVRRITSLCKAVLPPGLLEPLQASGDDMSRQFDIGVGHATMQVQELVDAGVPGIHFYVLNKSQATAAVLSEIRGL